MENELTGLDSLKMRLKRTNPRIWETKVFEVNVDGLLLEVHCSYCEGEPQTYDYPGSPSDLQINSIWLDNKDITSLFDYNNIEELLIEDIKLKLE
tara:strand:- start:417 stop:701 length:285 start_codon:yes stop_codon:yes gene_type:complete